MPHKAIVLSSYVQRYAHSSCHQPAIPIPNYLDTTQAPISEIVSGLVDYVHSLECPRYIRLFTKQEGASSHCQMGGLSYAQAAIFAWLEHALCGKQLKEANVARTQVLFVELFGKYGGSKGAAKARELLSEVAFV